MDKRFWAIIGVIIIAFGGILFFRSNNKASAPSTNAQPTSHTIGSGQKEVTLLEYGDFQCPYCSIYHPIVKQVVEKYKNDITFQFRHLPLPANVHPNAFAAARAAEAADKQNKFWEMYDLLYQNQDAWAQSGNAQAVFEQYAKQLGLKIAQFKKDFASSQVNSLINADIAAFKKTKEPMATPSFFLDGKYVDTSKFVDNNNQPTVEKFSQVIEAELAKKQP